MSPNSLICSKCGGSLNEGFIIEHALGNTAFSAKWHPGKPECNVFGGTQIEKDQLIPIRSYRCEQCGFLEFYANPCE